MSSSDAARPRCRLTASTPDEGTRIEILDGNLRTVPLDHNLGEVSVTVAPGVYAVRFYQGPQFTEKLVALTPSSPEVTVHLDVDEQPEFAAAAPIVGTSTTHEWQREPARALSRSTPRPGPSGHAGGSRVLLFLRNPFIDQPGDLPVEVSVFDERDREVFDLRKQGEHNTSQRWIGAHLDLDAGAYRIRRSVPDAPPVDQMLFTRRNWQTQVFLLGSRRRRSAIVRTSILMAPASAGFEFARPDLRRSESALRALESRGNVPGAARDETLWRDYDNPMLGLCNALLHLRRPEIDGARLRRVFLDLYTLVGPIPDVLVIGHVIATRDSSARNDAAFTAALSGHQAFTMPPMLRESWDHLLRLSAQRTDLVAAKSLADRVGGRLTASGPWVEWIAEDRQSIAAASAQEMPDDRVRLAVTTATGLIGRVLDLFRRAKQFVQDSAVKGTLSMLEQRLRVDPDARYWLPTKRFTDLERAIAYWLRPQINPELAGVLEVAPELAPAIEKAEQKHITDEELVALLTRLNVSSTTLLRSAWSTFTKLYAKPVIPDPARLKRFVKEESRGHSVFVRTFKHLAKRPSAIVRRADGLTLTLLEFAYLYYRGSPADAPARPSSQQLLKRLDEAGFVFAEGASLHAVERQYTALRAAAIGDLARRRVSKQFARGWERDVFPSAHSYSQGRLFPLLKKERGSEEKPTDSAPTAPMPA